MDETAKIALIILAIWGLITTPLPVVEMGLSVWNRDSCPKGYSCAQVILSTLAFGPFAWAGVIAGFLFNFVVSPLWSLLGSAKS